MEKLYKIQENDTVGWVDIGEPNCVKLTKDNCKIRLDELLAEGFNPNRLRAIIDE